MASSFIGKVLDNYRILESLGIGGMGVVFKAVNIKLDKLVALKMIAPGLAMNENFISRFQTEAKALAKLNDYNIVSISDLRSDNDQWFIVMEYVDGMNLFDKIKKDGAYSWQESLAILKQILRAIGHAHKAGIIHRDMKPNNVMITKEGVVKITDFGLAKDQTITSNTVSISSGGTLYYMSPEHVKGFSFTDQRSDIYSIGMTYYEMITGKVPFQNINSDFDLRERIIRKDFENPTQYNPEIPADLDAIVMKAIAKNPEHRFQTAEEMLKAVQKFEKSVKQPPAPARPKPVQPAVIETVPEETKAVYPKSSFLKKIIPVVLILALALFANFYFPDFLGSLFKKGFQQNAIISADSIQNEIPVETTSEDSVPVQEAQAPIVAEQEPEQTGKPADASAPLTISSRPTNAQAWLSGRYLGKTPCTLKDVEPGAYQLKILKTGYTQYSRRIQISENKQNRFNIRLSALTGKLSLSTQPGDAQILIDGQLKSRSALNQLDVGVHRLQVRKDGYDSHSQNFSIQSYKTTTLNIELKQQTGILTVQVRPWGSIFINNQLQMADTDIKYSVTLPSGKHGIKVVHPSLGTWYKNLEITRNATQSVLVNFNANSTVKFSAKDAQGQVINARIFVDNKDTGKLTPAEVALKIGVRKVHVEMDGYRSQPEEKELMVDANFREDQTFTLKKEN